MSETVNNEVTEEFIRPEGCFEEARQNKSAIRKEVLSALKKIKEADRKTKSESLRNNLLEFDEFQNSVTILTFASLPSEPDLMPLCEAEEAGHVTFCYPKVEGRNLGIYVVDDPKKQLKKTRGKLLIEPDPKKCEKLEVDDLDLVLVPGLAFAERSGGRLGRGGGFYDRLLAEEFLRAQSIGVGYGFQVRDSLPLEPHDELVDGILTDKALNMVH